MSVSVNFILDKRRSKKGGNFPVKLSVTSQRITKRFSTIYNLIEDEWNKLNKPRLSKELKIIEEELEDLKKKAKTIIKEIHPFTFNEFIIHFINQEPAFKRRRGIDAENLATQSTFDFTPYNKKFPILNETFPYQNTIGFYYQLYIKKLIEQGSISTAINYRCSYVSLMKFSPDLPFSAITVLFLNNYEQWLTEKNISRSTMGFYIRVIRTLFNEAIAEGTIKKEICYPFGKRKYKIPTSRNIKKALSIDEIKLLYYYQGDPNNISEQRAKAFWFFSYFASGMNPKDIALLKYKSIDGDILSFERAKTESHFRNEPKVITVFLSDELKSIIKQWGNKDKSPDNFVFPILEKEITPLRRFELIQLFVRSINDWMNRISQKLGLSRNATTYVARHSFSTILKRAGASTEYIQEALGHSSVLTTENYLGSFETSAKKKFSKMLEAFKEEG